MQNINISMYEKENTTREGVERAGYGTGVQSDSHFDSVNLGEQIKDGPWQVAGSCGVFVRNCAASLNNVDDYTNSIRPTRVPKGEKVTCRSDVSLRCLYAV